MTLKNIHYLSGLCISCFIGFHLFNHIVALQGIERHINTMKAFRVVYRNPFIETILLTTVVVQVVSGIRLFLFRRKLVVELYDKLHLWTGFYMAFFLLVHIGAVLAGRLILKLDTNFYFGVAGLNSFPFNLFFVPYYTLAIFAFFGHIAAIHYKKMKRNLLWLSPKKQANTILLAGVCICILILNGLTDHFRGVAIPSAYRVIIGQ